MSKALAQILTFITTLTIHSTDIDDLNFETIEHKSRLGICQMNEIKITQKNGENFKIKAIFNRPNLEEHKNKNQFDLELPIIFYYDIKTHQTKNVEQMLKERLQYIIKNGKSIDKLKDAFYDSYLLIDFGACDKNTFAIFSINDNCYFKSPSYYNAPYKYYEEMLGVDKDRRYHDITFSEHLDYKLDHNYYDKPKEIHILLKNKIKASDVRILNFTQEELYPSNINRIKIWKLDTMKECKEFRLHTHFDGPNIKGHPMKDNEYNIWLPIEIYYNRDDKDKIIEYIKPRLDNVIKDDTLDFDKLASEFSDSLKIIIFKKYRQYWDMFDTEKRVYHSIINKHDSEFLLYSDMCTQNYEIQGEMPTNDPANHFKSPVGLRIILKKLKEENKTTNLDKIKTKDGKDDATHIPNITKTKDGKDDATHIPDITKTKDNKKDTTSEKTIPKNSGCCKCCGCCPCNKQPN